MDQNHLIPDSEYAAALLTCVRMNTEIQSFLANTGYDIVRFNSVINAFLEGNILARREHVITLTEVGEDYLRCLNKALGRKGVYVYFLPDYSVRKDKITADSLYVSKYL